MIVLSSQETKAEIIAHIQRLMQLGIFPFIEKKMVDNLLTHLAWMARQKEDMNLQMKIETHPEILSTTIEFKIAYKQTEKARSVQ